MLRNISMMKLNRPIKILTFASGSLKLATLLIGFKILMQLSLFSTRMLIRMLQESRRYGRSHKNYQLMNAYILNIYQQKDSAWEEWIINISKDAVGVGIMNGSTRTISLRFQVY